MPSVETIVVFGSNSLYPCNACAMRARVERACWNGAVADSTASLNCCAIVPATNCLTTSPVTMPHATIWFAEGCHPSQSCGIHDMDANVPPSFLKVHLQCHVRQASLQEHVPIQLEWHCGVSQLVRSLGCVRELLESSHYLV